MNQLRETGQEENYSCCPFYRVLGSDRPNIKSQSGSTKHPPQPLRGVVESSLTEQGAGRGPLLLALLTLLTSSAVTAITLLLFFILAAGSSSSGDFCCSVQLR